MKHVRIVCAILVTALFVGFGAAALADTYMYPTGVFWLTVPQGWFAVDKGNVSQYVNNGTLADNIRSLFDRDDDHPIAVLFDNASNGRSFRNTMDIQITCHDGPFTADGYIDAHRNSYAKRLENASPQAQIVVPFQAATFGNAETAIHGYSWTDASGVGYARITIAFITAPLVYEITLNCLLDEVSLTAPALEELAAHFFVLP